VHREEKYRVGIPTLEVLTMASLSTREGATAMADESNAQSFVAKPKNWLAGVRQFWHEVVLEMKKVSWPTRTEVINTTIITIIVVFFFSLFLFGADIVLSYFIQGIEWAAKKVFS
jgi:preprotein translocase subunit SecE